MQVKNTGVDERKITLTDQCLLFTTLIKTIPTLATEKIVYTRSLAVVSKFLKTPVNLS